MAITIQVSDAKALNDNGELREGYSRGTSAGVSVITKTFAVGKVVALGKRRFEDDTEYIAIYYNDATRNFEEVGYGSTRGWTAGSAQVDATDAVAALYADYREGVRAASQRRLEELRRNELESDAACLSLTVSQVDRIQAMGSDRYDALFGLLKVKKHRSSFRASLNKQVRAWLDDPDPRYPSPLSAKQWKYL
jgi:hypothetical protein